MDHHLHLQGIAHATVSACPTIKKPCCISYMYVVMAADALLMPQVADALSKGVHYTVDEKQKSVLLTEEGYEAVEDVLQVRTHTCSTALHLAQPSVEVHIAKALAGWHRLSR